MIAQLNPLYIKTRPWKACTRLISYALFEGRPVTTRGRWINPLVTFLFAIEKRIPQLKKVPKPLFIVGTGRSGSTILGNVLSFHKEIGYLNEPKLLWHSVYPEEDLIGNYTRGEAFYRLGAEHANEQVKRRVRRIYGAYLRATGSCRVLDKYPELIFRVPFVQAIFPDAKFLFLVRNGWDTCTSISKWSKDHVVQPRNEVHDWWGVNSRKWKLLADQIVSGDEDLCPALVTIRSFKENTDRAAVEWCVTMKEGLALCQRVRESVMMVKFEDLTENPDTVLKDILEFCELDPDPKFLSYALRALHKVPRRDPVELHPSIRPTFDKTMAALGYNESL